MQTIDKSESKFHVLIESHIPQSKIQNKSPNLDLSCSNNLVLREWFWEGKQFIDLKQTWPFVKIRITIQT